MISIIVCCKEENVSKEMQDNIASTIGCGYELILIEVANIPYFRHTMRVSNKLKVKHYVLSMMMCYLELRIGV